jgi:hypothetical protein
MDKNPIFNPPWGNGQPIEGATYRPDVNELEDHCQLERHEQSNFERFRRWHNLIYFGSAGHDPALEPGYDLTLEHRHIPLSPRFTKRELRCCVT